MISSKSKMIFIPADCINANISRSYFLGKHLSLYFDLTWLTWNDSRNFEWAKKNKRFWFYRLYLFCLNIFKKPKFIQKNDISIFEIPFYGNSFIRFFLGDTFSLKITRYFNYRTLLKITHQIKPDIIFYADGFHFFPVIQNSKLIIFSDLQDDFDFQFLSKRLRSYTINYLSQCYKHSKKNYIVTNFAKRNLQKHLGVEFSVLPNGAEVSKIKSVKNCQIEKFRSKYNLQNKIVVTYIGGDVWFDELFMKCLAVKSLDSLPNVIYILIGDIPKIFSKNVINLGFVSMEETYVFYNLSDIGILPKDSKGNKFLLNSMPLKIIQYSCIGKPILCTDINWVTENGFSNVFITDFNSDSWINRIDELSTLNFQDSNWDNYNWENIAKFIYEDFCAFSGS